MWPGGQKTPRTRRQGSSRGPPHPAKLSLTATAFVQSWTGVCAQLPQCRKVMIAVHAPDLFKRPRWLLSAAQQMRVMRPPTPPRRRADTPHFELSRRPKTADPESPASGSPLGRSPVDCAWSALECPQTAQTPKQLRDNQARTTIRLQSNCDIGRRSTYSHLDAVPLPWEAPVTALDWRSLADCTCQSSLDSSTSPRLRAWQSGCPDRSRVSQATVSTMWGLLGPV